MIAARLTFSVRPHMCETSNSDPLDRQCSVASTSESLYWMGIDQPANGTILPAPVTRTRWSSWLSSTAPVLCTPAQSGANAPQTQAGPATRRTAMLDVEVVEGGLQQVGLVCKRAHAEQLAGRRSHPRAMRANTASA
jgi:hypothetical protein